MPKSNVNNCSQLVRIFALSSCAFLLSDHTQFCSQTVRNFALRPYAILLSDHTQFCSRTVRNFALGPYAILLSDRCSYSFLLSNRCSYPRPTGPPYVSDLRTLVFVRISEGSVHVDNIDSLALLNRSPSIVVESTVAPMPLLLQPTLLLAYLRP